MPVDTSSTTGGAATADGAATVSVVIPTCNRDAYLHEAVESALAQTVEPVEIIVVDDASDSDPRAQLAAFGEKVRLHRLATRSGASVARNQGVMLARGDYVAFLDDDDLWMPEKTEMQLRAMRNAQEERERSGDTEEVAACICIAQDLGGTPDVPLGIEDIEARLRLSTPCGTSALVAKRDMLLEEPFDPLLRRAEDWDLFVRLAKKRSLVFTEEPLYLRRVGHDRITTEVLQQTPQELYASAAAAHKHRTWLGETAYRDRLANLLLSFVAKRDHKLSYVASAIRHAGPRATLRALVAKLR